MYGTISGGNDYFSTRLNADPWDDASDSDKTKALTMSTEMVDRLNFRGEKADAAQELQFPRGSDTVVPVDVEKACYEISLALLDGVDPELEFENLRMKSQGYGVVRSTYDSGSIPMHLAAGIPSMVAWRYLKPYLRDVQTVNLTRVS